MSIGIQDLSGELVVRLTRVLARRPEYGIARPSRRWLVRQEEKIQHLPKELLRSTNMFKRLAMKIVDSIDPNIVDPQAVLCGVHSSLNAYLIRRLFMAVAYEVTVHTDTLRSWPGRTSAPELSAFVGRLDSITALWTEPELFHEIYGVAPFDGHHIFVTSGCEACCLAAVGASGRALADLRAALIDRVERRSGRISGKQPRLFRIVEAWIDHLRKNGEEVSRADECRDLSENLLVELRMARPQITAWRAEQKQIHDELRASHRSIYTELRRTASGAKIAQLPVNANRKRRTRNGIPIALADIEGAEAGRRAAMSRGRRESIYRPDSLAGFSVVHRRHEPADDVHSGRRPHAPEPDWASETSHGSPTHSFLHRFEDEIPLINMEDIENDCEEVQDLDERDYEEEERSRIKVQDWYSSRLGESSIGPIEDDAKSVMSRVHPAFRPYGGHISASALPTPLRVGKEGGEGADGPGRCPPSVVSEWTDCTVYTVEPTSGQSNFVPTTGEAPPVPKIPSEYGARKDFINEMNSIDSASPSSKKPEALCTNWPGAPRPLAKGNKPDAGRWLVSDSDVGSKLSAQRHEFLKERFKVKEPLDGSNAQVPGSSAVPSLSSSGSTNPVPDTIEDESDGEIMELKPDDSASNVHWNRTSHSSVTQMCAFEGKM